MRFFQNNKFLKIFLVVFIIFFILLCFLIVYLFLQNQKLYKRSLEYQTQVSPSPQKKPETAGKIYCSAKRPAVCTMECILPPPYLCGSDGKSYCSVCQACSNKNVVWYEMKVSPCGEGQVCGGITGATCPEGYFCKYDGDYPDASGKCVK